MSTRAPGGAVTALEHLAMWELSFDPALQRTMAAVLSLDMIGSPASAEAAEWVLWVARALEAMQRVAAKCWTGVSPNIRRVFLDLDDLSAPGAQSYVVNLRVDNSTLSPLRFAGLNSRPVREALADVYAAVEDTPSARMARGAAKVLERRPDFMQMLTAMRERVGRGLLFNRPGDTVGEALERTRAQVAGVYRPVPELADLVETLRAHNRLVTRIIWILLGLAEQFEPAVVTETVGAINERVVDGERRLDVTVRAQHFALLRPTHPVLVQMSNPLDDLYWVSRHELTLGDVEENDLGLVALE